MRSINRNLYPKDGFHFVERDGAKVFGDSWGGVIKRVENYRKRAGYPIGNVEEEVMAQACARNPGLCSEENAAYKQAVTHATLKSRLLQWLTTLQRTKTNTPIIFSSEQDARNRATVCASCPFNKQLPDGCSSCRAAVTEMRRSIIGGRLVDGRIHACEILGEDLPVASWIEQQTVDNGALPGHCWRKRVL